MATIGKEQVEAAKKFVEAAIAALQDEKGVHAETAVAATARMAGTFLFRSFGFSLPNLTPGQPVLSDQANERGPALVNTLGGVLSQLGINLDPSTLGAESKAKPNLAFLETQKRLEPAFTEIKDQFGLTLEEASQAAAIATALLIQKTAGILDPQDSFNLAVYAFVEGTKTAPDPAVLV